MIVDLILTVDCSFNGQDSGTILVSNPTLPTTESAINTHMFDSLFIIEANQCGTALHSLGIAKSECEYVTLRNIRVMASMQQQQDQRSDAAISSRGAESGSNRVVAVMSHLLTTTSIHHPIMTPPQITRSFFFSLAVFCFIIFSPFMFTSVMLCYVTFSVCTHEGQASSRLHVT